MPKVFVESDATNVFDGIVLKDFDGIPVQDILYSDANLRWSYKAQGSASWTAITLANMTAGTHLDDGFTESDDGTKAPGWYQLGYVDARFAAGFGQIDYTFWDATATPRFQQVDWQIQEGISVTAIGVEMKTRLEDIDLDHLLKVAESSNVTTNSVIAKLAATGGIWSTFSSTTDALEALYNNMGPASDGDLATDLNNVLVDTTNTLARLPAALSTAGNIKADVEEVNETTVGGDGGVGTEWGPL